MLCFVHACFSHFFFVECIMTFASKTEMAHSVTDVISVTNFYFLLQNYSETTTSVWKFYFTSLFYTSFLICRWRRDSGVGNVNPNCPVPTSAVRLYIVLQCIFREPRNLTHSQHWRVKSHYGVDVVSEALQTVCTEL